MAAGGNPTAVRVGPGRLYIAPVGTTEPVDLATAWDVAWVPLGYTDSGHTFTMTPKFEQIDVAEEIDVLRNEPSGREMTVAFDMAEMTALNLSYALNGGTVTTSTGLVEFEPPDAGDVTRIALGWEATDGLERWVFRKCIQTGKTDIKRAKAPDKATIPVEFALEVVAGQAPFKALFQGTP